MQQAIIRLVVLAVALINQALTMFGWNPLPFSDEEVYEGVSALFMVGAAIWTWWKDNPVSKKAQHNENFLKQRGMKK